MKIGRVRAFLGGIHESAPDGKTPQILRTNIRTPQKISSPARVSTGLNNTDTISVFVEQQDLIARLGNAFQAGTLDDFDLDASGSHDPDGTHVISGYSGGCGNRR